MVLRSKQALDFTQALLGAEKEVVVKKDHHEPKNQLKRLEAEVQRSIVEYLDFYAEKGLLFYQRTNTTGIYDKTKDIFRKLPKGVHAGFPDIFILCKGRAIFVECKSSTGDQSVDQAVIQEKIEKQGGEYYIVRTLDYLIKLLRL